MYLIVGLGNPGIEYRNTRHNIGFNAVDYLGEKYNIDINRKKFKGEYGEGRVSGDKVILLKPTTYMNLSGESIKEAANFYKIPNDQIIVIYDDVSLDIGRLRIRGKGSAGGHNGIKSIISHLNSDVFPRIKIGVGQPEGDLIAHVLGKFSKDDMDKLQKVIDVAVLATEEIIKNDEIEAMNKYNGFSL